MKNEAKKVYVLAADTTNGAMVMCNIEEAKDQAQWNNLSFEILCFSDFLSRLDGLGEDNCIACEEYTDEQLAEVDEKYGIDK